MPSLDAHERRIPTNCRRCNHSWHVAIKTAEGTFVGCYCMLDVPEEDRNCVENEVSKESDYIPKLSNYLTLFSSLRELEGYPDLAAVRYVEDTNCCQFYEKEE